MRVLVCQTPKLTYVQAIELLQRETAESVCDLAVLPEMAMEHPPQCTSQGELSFENVALLMLSRFARQHRIYIVLGSVEERTPFAKIYDTCIVIDRQGEILLQYRKQSVSSPAKAAGTEPGIFETEFGPIGLLLGAEAEEEHRWAPLIARRPCLLLNPTREPAKMDPVLAKAHPELQVAAWHQGFSRLERNTDLLMRSYSCPFVRADAPLQEGGAGISILVEQHRSVLAPCWGSVFFIVETAHPSELVSRRLPGWHQLTIDERIEAAQYDKEVLMQEEVVRGPRYLVWTFRLPQAQLLAIKREGQHWAIACKESSPCIDNADRCWLMPLTSHGGRALYAVATRRGGLTLWDVRQKRDVFTCNLGASASVTAGGGFSNIAAHTLGAGAVVTAVGPWNSRSQYILASAALAGLALRVFDERTPTKGTVLQRGSLPWSAWPCADFLTGLPLPGPYPEDRGEPPQSELGHHGEPPPDVVRPVIRAVYPFDHFMAIAVLEGPGSCRVPMGLLIDLESGSTEPLDIYGAGPVEPEEDEEQTEEHLLPRRQEEEEEVKRPTGPDLLVGCHFIEQRFQERGHKPQRALVCLYRSNRICLMTCADWTLHEQLLVEEMASARQRHDVPVACAVLPNLHSGTYHIVVSYASMVIRWWQASLSQCRLQSNVLLPAIATHVAILEWPSAMPPEKPATTANPAAPPAPGPPAPAAAAGRGGAGRRAQGKASTTTRLPPLVPPAFGAPIALPGGRSVRQSTVSIVMPAASSPGPPASALSLAMPAPRARSLLPMPPQALDAGSGSTTRGRFQRDSVMTRGSLTTATEENRATPSTFPEYAYHAASLLVVAFEASGAMPIFLAHGGRMVRAFTCLDHFVYKDTCVDQLWCLDRSIAVQLSNGDVRHFEFLVEGEVINLVDMPIEGP